LLLDGGKVKVTIMFRGREITYTSFGRKLLDRMAVDMTPIATIEREAKLEGKNMFMILAPRAVPTGPPKFTSQPTPTEAVTPTETSSMPVESTPPAETSAPADIPEPVEAVTQGASRA
ncbi:MAG: translation initiation factor IF-3 C-terminal domain-containing protein, partial [Vulcanimicrobiaceae bacterium]